MENATRQPVTTLLIGTLRITAAAWEEVEMEALFESFIRHLNGNWGDLDEHDWKANDDAIEYGGRVLSSYLDRNDTRFWIITEADRSATTILLPSEY